MKRSRDNDETSKTRTEPVLFQCDDDFAICCREVRRSSSSQKQVRFKHAGPTRLVTCPPYSYLPCESGAMWASHQSLGLSYP